MAWTVRNTPTTFGDKAVRLLKITPDSATFAVQTGLGTVEHVGIFFSSCATNGFKVAVNSGCTGIAAPGTLGITGVASGDEFYITVYGR
ncbi:MAG: hypothetical protein V4750_02720 [Pseudomonadota bacterium]